jgi:hypothetical protein
MNVVVALTDGSKIYPIYEPALGRLESLTSFYSSKVAELEIRGYSITDDSGKLLVSAGVI